MPDTFMPGAGIRLFRTADGPVVEMDGSAFRVEADWDELFEMRDCRAYLRGLATPERRIPPPDPSELLAPIGRQEVWAAGVTYVRSKTARMSESKESGGGDFYDRVYDAPRPELFFKASAHRVSGPSAPVRIRRDTRWSVPEPELALAVNALGTVFGYTVGNDMSARDIEGENPLYLPQAKVYDQCCGLGPSIWMPPAPLPPDTVIHLVIARGAETVLDDSTALSEMKRSIDELVDYLFTDSSFPHGCFLLTGTGIVPPDTFSLEAGDRIRITIEPIGTLENHVVQTP